MKAIVQDRYGSTDVLELREIDRPSAGDDDVLVRVRAASVHADVWHAMKGVPFVLRAMGSGLRAPKHPVPGTDLAGTVESLGTNVTRFRPGDDVFGLSISANLWRNGGAFAEYAAVPAATLEAKPTGLSFEQAAAVPTSGSLAVQHVRDEARIREGQTILINGAGGAVGSFAVQLAKAWGATVTAVDATEKLEMLRSLGADQVLDYTKEDFTQNGETYDVVFDAVGKHSFRRSRRSLKPGGTCIETDLGFMWHVPPLALLSRWIGDKKVTLPIPKYTKENVVFIKELIVAGEYRAVIDRRYPLEQVVEATKYVETEQKTGNVVLTLSGAVS